MLLNKIIILNFFLQTVLKSFSHIPRFLIFLKCYRTQTCHQDGTIIKFYKKKYVQSVYGNFGQCVTYLIIGSMRKRANANPN